MWDVPEADLPGPGVSAYELLDGLGQEGGVRALLVLVFFLYLVRTEIRERVK